MAEIFETRQSIHLNSYATKDCILILNLNIIMFID